MFVVRNVIKGNAAAKIIPMYLLRRKIRLLIFPDSCCVSKRHVANLLQISVGGVAASVRYLRRRRKRITNTAFIAPSYAGNTREKNAGYARLGNKKEFLSCAHCEIRRMQTKN